MNQSRKNKTYRRSTGPYPAPFDRFPVIKPLLKIDKVRLAMMIDCEGSIGMGRKKLRRLSPRISFANTHEGIVKLFKKLTSCKRDITFRRSSKKNSKGAYRLALGSMPLIYLILKRIIPFFIIKKTQAELLLEFIRIQDERTRKSFNRKEMTNYSKRQLYIFKKLHELNLRGRRGEVNA